MADTKITALAAIATVDPAADVLPIVDISDTSMAASGTTKKVTTNQILGSGGTATLASATITGAATVGTTLGVTGASTLSSDLTVRSGNKLILNRADNAVSTQLNDQGSGIGFVLNNVNGDGILFKVAGNGVYSVGSSYTQTWFDGAGGTRMTLNSTGLGVGVSPRAKLDVSGGLLVNYSTATTYAPLSVKTAAGIATPSTFTNAISIYNTTTVGDYSNITFGYNALGLTNASAYIGYVCTSATSGGFGDLVFGTRSVGTDTAATERVRIDATGNLLVGKTATNSLTVGNEVRANGEVFSNQASSGNAATTYHVYSTGAAAYRFYVGLGGTVFATNTTISAISDARLKENVQDIDVGLDAILALKPRTFDWKAGKGKNIKGDRGFIAQEFETVFPNLIDEWKDAAPEGETPYKSVRADLIPVLVKAIQELAAEVNALKNA